MTIAGNTWVHQARFQVHCAAQQIPVETLALKVTERRASFSTRVAILEVHGRERHEALGRN